MEETVNLKLTSDGTPEGTVITDQHGRRLDSVIGLSWEVTDAGYEIVLRLIGIPVSIQANPKILPFDGGDIFPVPRGFSQ